MTSLIEKARLGRMNALSGLPGGRGDHGPQSRVRFAGRHENVTFISSRARSAADTISA
jgi:hypothetical protein